MTNDPTPPAADAAASDAAPTDPEGVEALVASLARLHALDDDVERGLAMAEEAGRLGLDTAHYHYLYDLYDQNTPVRRHRFEELFQRLVAWCERQSFFSILEYVGRLAIVFAIGSFFLELPQRLATREGEAWAAIQAAEGRAWSGDRQEDLESLATSCFVLEGLAAPGARLEGLQLDGCRGPLGGLLSGTWLARLLPPRGAVLIGANLRDADLRDARLPRADLTDATLAGARLQHADLSEARLIGAQLRDADLFAADLTGADLTGADLTGADLTHADLRGAHLDGAILDRTTLAFTDLRDAVARRAKLRHSLMAATRLDDANLLGSELGGAQIDRLHVNHRTIFDHVVWEGARMPAGTLTVDQLDASEDTPILLPEAAGGGVPTIGMIAPVGATFFHDVVAGAEEAARRGEARLRVVYLDQLDATVLGMTRLVPQLGPFTRPSLLRAESLATEMLLAEGIDVLLLAPLESAVSETAVRRVFDAGVPVVFYEHSNLHDEPKRWIAASFTSDHYRMGFDIGRHAARWAASRRDRADEPWRVGLVRACEFQDCFLRVEGFRDAFEASGVPWEERFYRRIRFDPDSWAVTLDALADHRETYLFWSANDDGT
ncbi:MAG: pentapeptide repeat-containing protein, partial [Acidobacteriota bacterium]